MRRLKVWPFFSQALDFIYSEARSSPKKLVQPVCTLAAPDFKRFKLKLSLMISSHSSHSFKPWKLLSCWG
jgi:hypothetical protein